MCRSTQSVGMDLVGGLPLARPPDAPPDAMEVDEGGGENEDEGMSEGGEGAEGGEGGDLFDDLRSFFMYASTRDPNGSVTDGGFHELPVDFQIAVATYYFVRYSTLDEAKRFELVKPDMTSDGFTTLKNDFMRSQFSERYADLKNPFQREEFKEAYIDYPYVGVPYPSLLLRQEHITDYGFSMDKLYMLFSTRVSEVESLCKRNGIGWLAESASDKFVFNPMEFHTSPASDPAADEVDYKLYHFLPGWAIMAYEIGFSKSYSNSVKYSDVQLDTVSVDESSNETVKAVDWCSGLLQNPVFGFDAKSYEFPMGTPFYTAIDSMFDSMNEMKTTSKEEHKLLWELWLDAMEKYKRFGEIPYPLYHNIARTHMILGFYERPGSLNPMWSYFYGIKPVNEVECLLTASRFNLQIMRKASHILGMHAVGGKITTTSIDVAHSCLLRTASTVLVAQQNLYRTWNNLVDIWLGKMDSLRQGDPYPRDIPMPFQVAYYQLCRLAYTRNENTGRLELEVHPAKSNVRGAMSVFDASFTSLVAKEYYPQYDEQKDWRLDFVWVPTVFFTDVQLAELANVNFDFDNNAISFVGNPERILALEYVELRIQNGSCSVIAMSTDLEEKPYTPYTSYGSYGKSKHRNPIGLTTYSSYDSIYGSRRKVFFESIRDESFPGQKSDDLKESVYGMVENKLNELSKIQIRHPKYGFPRKVDEVRLKYGFIPAADRGGDSGGKDVDVFERTSGYMEGDSIRCILLDPVRQCENVCVYNAIKKRSEIIDVAVKLHDFFVDSVLPAYQTFVLYVKRHKEKVGATNQDHNLQSYVVEFSGSAELQQFRASHESFLSQHYSKMKYVEMKRDSTREIRLIGYELDGLIQKFIDHKHDSGETSLNMVNKLNDIQVWIIDHMKTRVKELSSTMKVAKSQYGLVWATKDPRVVRFLDLLGFLETHKGLTKDEAEKLKYSTQATPEANGNLIGNLSIYPETSRGLTHDLYHCLANGDEYTDDLICSGVFRVEVPQKRITMVEVQNQMDAFSMNKNATNSLRAIRAFLEKRYSEHWQEFKDNPPPGDSLLKIHMDKNRKAVLHEKWFTTQDIETKSGPVNFNRALGILEEYNTALATHKQRTDPSVSTWNIDQLTQQTREESTKERQMGYIKRRERDEPSNGEAKFYPCVEILNTKLQTMSYTDLGPVNVSIKSYNDVFNVLESSLEELLRMADDVHIEFWDALNLFEKVENAVESLFIHGTLLMSNIRKSSSENSSKKADSDKNLPGRDIEQFTKRQSTGPSTDVRTLQKNKGVVFTEEQKKRLGISTIKSRRFVEAKITKSFQNAFFVITNPFAVPGAVESNVKIAMRRNEGRRWTDLLTETGSWFNNYEMFLLYNMQVLGNVFRYGGYRAVAPTNDFEAWRYPNYSSDIDSVKDTPIPKTEEYRFYQGILDEDTPDERKWNERMLGDKISPPRWRTREIDGMTYVDSRVNKPLDERADFCSYMFTDEDSIVKTFHSIVSRWKELLDPSQSASEDLKAADARAKTHLDASNLQYSLTGDDKLKNILQFDINSDDLQGILFDAIQKSDATDRSRLPILVLDVDFQRDSFDRILGPPFEASRISYNGYPKLFTRVQPYDEKALERHRLAWISKVMEIRLTLRLHKPYVPARPDPNYGTNGMGGPRWGGSYNLDGLILPAPDLKSALEFLNKETDKSGPELVDTLFKMGIEHANTEIEYNVLLAKYNDGDVDASTLAQINELATWREKVDSNNATIQNENSLYNVVRHAYQLYELDRKLLMTRDEMEQTEFEKIMKPIASHIGKLMSELERNLTTPISEPARMLLVEEELEKGIRWGIELIGRRAYNLGIYEADIKYNNGKSQTVKKKIDEILNRMNKLFQGSSTVLFKSNTAIEMVLAMKNSEMNEGGKTDVFERLTTKERFNTLFMTVVDQKYPASEERAAMRTQIIDQLKLDLRIIYKLYAIGGFPRRIVDSNRREAFYKKFKREFDAIHHAGTWNAITISAQKQKRSTLLSNSTHSVDRASRAAIERLSRRSNPFDVSGGSKRRKVQEKDEFLDSRARTPLKPEVEQSMKELARDTRLLTVGFQDPYFPDEDSKQRFLTRIQEKKRDYENTLVTLKTKYPGIRDMVNRPSDFFASLQRYANEFYGVITRIQQIEQHANKKAVTLIDESTAGRNFHYLKTDPLAATMISNDQGVTNQFEIALAGKVAFEILLPKNDGSAGDESKWFLMDLVLLYDNDSTRAIYNSLRRLTLDTMSALDREFQLSDRRMLTSDVQINLPAFKSLVEELNSQSLKFERRACLLIKKVIQQITFQMGSPQLIKEEVEEFTKSNPAISSPRFMKVFNDLCEDLQTVIEFEERWEDAIQYLHVLRMEDLYQRIRLGSLYDTAPPGPLLDSMDYEEFAQLDDNLNAGYIEFVSQNGVDRANLVGIDLRYSTDSDGWNSLKKRYVDLSPTKRAEEENQRSIVGSMRNTMRRWQSFTPPTLDQVINAMTALESAGGRDPEVQRRRPIIRAVDRTEKNFYAYFVDMLCLSHEYPKRYTEDIVKEATELANLENIPLTTDPNGATKEEVIGLRLARIYNPNQDPSSSVALQNAESIDAFYSNSRYLKKKLKFMDTSVHVVNEVIRNYSLVREFALQGDDGQMNQGQTIFETEGSLVASREKAIQLPTTDEEFSYFLQDFKQRFGAALNEHAITDDTLQEADYASLKANIDIVEAGRSLLSVDEHNEIMRSVFFIARYLVIPVYPRPQDTKFANERTYMQTLSIARKKWLTATAVNIELANPKNLYDKDFVQRLALSDSPDDYVGAVESTDSDIPPEDDFARLIGVQFKYHVDALHSGVPADSQLSSTTLALLQQGETRGSRTYSASFMQEQEITRHRDDYTNWLSLPKTQNVAGYNDNRRLKTAARPNDWVSKCETVTNGDCLYHSLLINMGSIFLDNDTMKSSYYLSHGRNSIEVLKGEIMSVFQTAVDDLQYYKTVEAAEAAAEAAAAAGGGGGGGDAIEPGRFLFNPAQLPAFDDVEYYKRWKCCSYLNLSLEALKIGLFQAGGHLRQDYEKYEEVQEQHGLRVLSQDMDPLEIMKELVKFFGKPRVYANDFVIEMMVHMLRTPCLIFEGRKPMIREDGYLQGVLVGRYGPNWTPGIVDVSEVVRLIQSNLENMDVAAQNAESGNKRSSWTEAHVQQMLQRDSFVRVPIGDATWKWMTGTLKGEEYASDASSYFLLFRPSDHFQALYPKHLEDAASAAMQLTWPDGVTSVPPSVVQQSTAVAASSSASSMMINVFEVRVGRLS